MKTQKIIALVVLAGVAVAGVGMYRKSKSSGYANATGRTTSQNCAVCRTSSGDNYHTGDDRNCNTGDTCVTKYAFTKQILPV